MKLQLNGFSEAVRRKLPIVIQEEITDCGHACVTMIGNYWGHEFDLYALKQKLPTSPQGTSLLEINTLLGELGVMTRALQVPLEEIHLVKCPAIIHWNMNHFVVLKAVKKNQMIIHDPASGLRKLSLAEFSNAFTGIVLEATGVKNFQPIQDKKKLTLLEIFKVAQGVRQSLVFLLALSLGIETFSLIQPLFTQYITDNIIGLSEKSNLGVITLLFLVFTGIHTLIDYARGNLIIFIGNHFTEQFAANVMHHLLKLPLQFFESRHKGDIQAKMYSIDEIQKKITTDFVNTVLDGLMIILNLIVMTIYSWLLTLIVLLILFLTLLIRYFSYRYLQKFTEISIQEHAKSSTVFLETLQAILSIKAHLKENTRLHRWRNNYIQALNADIRIAQMNVKNRVAEQLLSQIELIGVLCIGAGLVLNNYFSLGMLMAFLSYRVLFITRASSFMQNIIHYQLINIQLRRLSDILWHQPEHLLTGKGQIALTKGKLHLENLSFRYHPQSPYLFRNLCLTIEPGEKVAIIGPSGCGKTSLLKVAMGLFEATEGELWIDGMRLRDFGLKNYREMTASVMQEDALLSGSILNNIAFFEENIDVERAFWAARLAAIHEVIEKLPMGYETIIGDLGSLLSGGQKQRILLARALYKRPKFLFLDEATSHLDIENEKVINAALKALDITQVIVAHRPETIRMADRVVDLREFNNTFV